MSGLPRLGFIGVGIITEALITGMCAGANVEMGAHAAVIGHMARVRERPGFQRALAREQQALDSAGIVLPGGRL